MTSTGRRGLRDAPKNGCAGLVVRQSPDSPDSRDSPNTPNTPNSLDLLGLLRAATIAAGDGLEPLAALARAVPDIGEFTGWPVGHAYLADSDGTLRSTGVWYTAAGVGLDEFRRASDTMAPWALGSLPGRVRDTRAPVWIDDLDQDTDLPRTASAAAAGLRAGFAFPVLVGEEIVAVLEFFCRRPVEPDPALLVVIETIGRQLGQVFERARARHRRDQGAAWVRELLDNAGDGFVAMDPAGRVTAWNQQAETMFGWSSEEALGQQLADLIVPEQLRAAHTAGLQRFLDTGVPRVLGQRLELSALRRGGEQFPIELTLWSVQTEGSWTFYGFARDLTERKAHEHELAHRASHDELTGLANRALVVEHLASALERAAHRHGHLGALFVDLDRFKVVNDSLGHEIGDRVLCAIGERLTQVVRPSDTVARFEGDKFVVVCEDLVTASDAERIAQRVLDAVQCPIEVDGEPVRVGVSIGIAFAGAGVGCATDLLRDADAAMYHAKEQGRGRVEVFDDRMRDRIRGRMQMERDLSECVDRGQLRLHYQPLVAMSDQRVVGVEALLRWAHPQRGLVSPTEFIPLAEETGLIVPIGTWVLEEACRQAREWQRRGCVGMSVAVNLSARQLSHPQFLPTLTRILSQSGLDRARVAVNFEVTESVLCSDPDAAVRTLTELRRLGAEVSIDDFGTGYSSLAYLNRFPVDVVKIDRSFIVDIDTDPRELAIVRAVTDLGHALGLTVLAEGIETDAQQAELRAIGCDIGQGFHFARPVPAQEVFAALPGATPARPAVPWRVSA
jgi:diguanylate cyclase (GGDEF)-like protein/PAS domain S-box-containing protein